MFADLFKVRDFKPSIYDDDEETCNPLGDVKMDNALHLRSVNVRAVVGH